MPRASGEEQSGRQLGRSSVIDQQELMEAAQEELVGARTGKIKLSVDEKEELVDRIIGMGTT
jgi:hypothetical protein